MNLTVIAFYLFATVAVASGLLVVLARNPVHSVLWLILTFFSAAGLFVLVFALALGRERGAVMGVPYVAFLGPGILMMTVVTLGSMTPPVGVAMYTVCSLLNCKIEDYVRESLPFLAAIIALVAVLLFVPDLVLFLPRLAFG